MHRPLKRAAIAATAMFALSCQPLPVADESMRTVTGTAAFRDDPDLPPRSEVVVSFVGLRGEVLVEERSRVGDREPPFPFHLWVPADRIGTVTARVDSGPRTTWRSVSALLNQGPDPVRLGALPMRPVNEAAPPPTSPPPAAEAPAGRGGFTPATAAAPPAAPAEADEPEAPEPVAEDGPIRLACGESRISVTTEGGAAEVAIGNTVVEMAAVDAEEGGRRRYAVPNDPQTYLSVGQDEAEVSFAGVVLPDCTVEEPAG